MTRSESVRDLQATAQSQLKALRFGQGQSALKVSKVNVVWLLFVVELMFGFPEAGSGSNGGSKK